MSTEQLPPELWARIFKDLDPLTRKDLKALCLVCRIFKDLSRERLFGKVQATPEHLSGHCDLHLWKRDLGRMLRSQKRLVLLAGNTDLAKQVHTLHIHVRSLIDVSELDPQKESDLLLRDTAKHLQESLAGQLHQFPRLCRLELMGSNVSEALLKSIADHTSLLEIKLVGCTLPVNPPALSSTRIRSFEFKWLVDAEASSAYALISPVHAERVTITNQSPELTIQPVSHTGKQFCECASLKGQYNQLRELHIGPQGIVPTYDLKRLLTKTPALRTLVLTELEFQKAVDPRASLDHGEPRLPMPCIPLLDSVECSLDRAKYLVPGRPVRKVKADVNGCNQSMFIPTAARLADFLHPLTLSTATLTTLHLPLHVIAPVWLLSDAISSLFPSLSDLRFTVSWVYDIPVPWHASVDTRGFRRFGVPLDESNTPQMIQKAADEVFTEVEARLSAGYLPGTRRVAPDPIMTHRIQGGLEESVVPSARALGNLVGFSGIRVSLQSFWDTETTVDNARRPIRNLADVFKYFGEGYYPLPRMLQKLTLNLPSSTYMRDSVGFHKKVRDCQEDAESQRHSAERESGQTAEEGGRREGQGGSPSDSGRIFPLLAAQYGSRTPIPRPD